MPLLNFSVVGQTIFSAAQKHDLHPTISSGDTRRTMISMTSAFLALCFTLSLFHASVLAAPSETADLYRGSCKDLLQRKEWRALSDTEKKSYIDAVKCLQSQPAHNTSRPTSWTRFDEFQAHHIEIAINIHYVGEFLPWHRHLVKVYETALRKECGYKGAQPYWDWSQDSDAPNLISTSSIWNSVTGFGGNGVPGTYTVPPDPANTSRIRPPAFRGCVRDGPFANYTLKLGPGLLVTNHCLTRGLNDTASRYLNTSAIKHTLTFPTYESFSIQLEGALEFVPDHRAHDGGHVAVGGEMSNFFSSPGDPIFYLHHSNLDRIWWQWQKAAPGRLYEVSGRTSITPPYGALNLSYPLRMGNLGPTVPVRDVMDTRKAPYCYTYV